MLDQVLEIFTSDYDLNIMKKQQSLAQITTRILEGLDKVMKETNPILCLYMGIQVQRLLHPLQPFIIKLQLVMWKRDFVHGISILSRRKESSIDGCDC